MIDSFYLCLHQNQPAPVEQAALLLAVFSFSAFFYPPSYQSEVVQQKHEPAMLSKALGGSALDALDHCRRASSGTLEEIQAYLFMSYLAYHHDGFSARGRSYLAVAVAMARDIGLHRTDATGSSEFGYELTAHERFDREMKRRVFWYLVTADWCVLRSLCGMTADSAQHRLTASISGPQEGMYFIHPRQINVKLPRDVDDENIALLGSDRLSPDDRPAGMSYYLQRVQLAHLCREMVDLVPPDSKIEHIFYDDVIALDRKLVTFFDQLPFYFKTDKESCERAKALEAIKPNLKILRFCITRAAHSRRIKLHQRFLLRQSTDPRFAYSRHACLESARIVIQFYDGFNDGSDPFIANARMGLAVHYMHLALVALVMDLCVNRGMADEAQTKAEVKAGLKMFEHGYDRHPLLHKFTRSLKETLRKHGVHLNGSGTAANVSGEMAMEVEPCLSDTDFDAFWQGLMQEDLKMDLDKWDDVFADVDLRPL
jgi:hypothetical protein